MNMGSTGTINMTVEMLNNAIRAIEDYQTAVTSINSKLDTEINALIPASFSGSAAEGLKFFYNDKIQPVTNEGLTKMLDALNQICATTRDQIPGEDQGVDEQLGNGNRNPSAAEE